MKWPGQLPHPVRALLHPGERQHAVRRDRPAQEDERAAAEDSQVTASADAGRQPFTPRQEYEAATLDEQLSRAATRIAEEEADRKIVRTLPSAMRESYDEQVWAARNPGADTGPEAYRRYRFYRWQERNHQRVAGMALDDRWENFRADEALGTVQGLPASTR